MGKAEILVLGELRCSGGSSSHQTCRGLGCGRGFRRRVRDPRRRGLSPGRSIHCRRGVLAALRGSASFRVLLRDELEQGCCHGGADVLAGLGFRPGLLGVSQES